MGGRFTGLKDEQCRFIQPLFPQAPKRVGRPNPNLRKIINTILYVEITGCRWCDVPIGDQWGKRSTAHEWLGKFQEMGLWEKVKNRILSKADLDHVIDWDKGAVDGSFSPRERRWRRG